MPHELLDYSLIAAIMGWITKQGIDIFQRSSKKNNGPPSLEAIRQMANEISERNTVLLTDIRDIQRDIQIAVSELVTVARMKLN